MQPPEGDLCLWSLLDGFLRVLVGGAGSLKGVTPGSFVGEGPTHAEGMLSGSPADSPEEPRWRPRRQPQVRLVGPGRLREHPGKGWHPVVIPRRSVLAVDGEQDPAPWCGGDPAPPAFVRLPTLPSSVSSTHTPTVTPHAAANQRHRGQDSAAQARGHRGGIRKQPGLWS